LGLQKDFSWFVTDSQGVQKWRDPFQEPGTNVLTVGKNFAFRDYFHGNGADYEPATAPFSLEPIRQPRISHRFLGPNGSYFVAVTVPIWGADHKQPIGVLGRTIEIGSLLDEYGRAIFEETGPAGRAKVSREIALIERVQGNLLDHTWFDKNDALIKKHPLTTAELDSLRVSDRLRSKLQGLDATVGPGPRRDFVDDENYADPLSRFEPAAADLGGEWLAAFAAVPETTWVTVVQERRSAALEPVQDMKTRLRHDGWWALLASCGLIGLLWYFVGRALNDRTPRLWVPRTGRRRGDIPESGLRTPSSGARSA
jgi:hypothetical protein